MTGYHWVNWGSLCRLLSCFFPPTRSNIDRSWRPTSHVARGQPTDDRWGVVLRVDLDWLFRKALVDRNLQSQAVYFRILQVKCQECVEVEVWALIKKQLHDACGLFVLIIQDGPVLKDVVLILMDEYWAKWQVPLYRLDPAFSRSWFIWSSRATISGWSSLVIIPTESPLLSFQLLLFELNNYNFMMFRKLVKN